MTIDNGEYALNAHIRYYATLQETNSSGELQNRDPNSSILIITDKMLLYLKIDREGPTRGKPHLIFKTKLRKLKHCEVYSLGNQRFGYIYCMVLQAYSRARGLEKFQFQCLEFTKLEKCYNILSV